MQTEKLVTWKEGPLKQQLIEQYGDGPFSVGDIVDLFVVLLKDGNPILSTTCDGVQQMGFNYTVLEEVG